MWGAKQLDKPGALTFNGLCRVMGSHGHGHSVPLSVFSSMKSLNFDAPLFL